MAETRVERSVRIAGRRFELRRRDVVRAMRKVEPEPITSHYVVVGSRRFPPKQVISAVTGVDRADFTTHQARRTLLRLGFSAGRRGGRALTHPPGRLGDSAQRVPAPERLADRLRPLAGQWVAIRDEDIIYSAGSPQALVGWLAQHGQKADSVFRVPEDEVAATGLAPL
jgi:hypothetical protein